MKDKNLIIIRHWLAKYENLETDKRWSFDKNQFLKEFKFLKDLKEEGIEDLEKYIDSFIRKYVETLKTKNIHLWVSPFWRTIETSYIFIKKLAEYNIENVKINLFSHLQEAKNFSWQIFDWLVEGKEININNKKIQFDKTITNPENLTHGEYFFKSYWKQIPQEYLKWIDVFEKVLSIENYENITQRSKKAIHRVLSLNNEDNLVIMFSHQCFSDHIIKKQENYKNWWQKVWEILIINKDTSYERFKANS